MLQLLRSPYFYHCKESIIYFIAFIFFIKKLGSSPPNSVHRPRNLLLADYLSGMIRLPPRPMPMSTHHMRSTFSLHFYNRDLLNLYIRWRATQADTALLLRLPTQYLVYLSLSVSVTLPLSLSHHSILLCKSTTADYLLLLLNV